MVVCEVLSAGVALSGTTKRAVGVIPAAIQTGGCNLFFGVTRRILKEM